MPGGPMADDPNDLEKDPHNRDEDPRDGIDGPADQDEQPDPRRAATQQDFGRELTRATQRAGLSGGGSALARARSAPGRRAAGTTAPYRGLASFEPEVAEWFFGREYLTRQLLIRATADAGSTPGSGPTPGSGSAAGVPLVVIGSSGSGKSSLLRA